MGDPKVPPIGPRIRTERERRNVTIRALARVIGVSPSLISQIETGKSQPSVSSLYSITSALGLSLEDLFDASDAESSESQGTITSMEGIRYLRSDRAKGVGPHVSPNDRELLTLESGVTWERLGQVPHLLEVGHRVADRGWREAERVLLRHLTGADRLGRHGVLEEHGLEDLPRAGEAARLCRCGCWAEGWPLRANTSGVGGGSDFAFMPALA